MTRPIDHLYAWKKPPRRPSKARKLVEKYGERLKLGVLVLLLLGLAVPMVMFAKAMYEQATAWKVFN